MLFLSRKYNKYYTLKRQRGKRIGDHGIFSMLLRDDDIAAVIALYGRTVNINLSMLVISVAVGCGGYFALSLSKGLEEALLANKLVYVTVAFAPMCVFLIICDICRVRVPAILNAAMHTLQVVIFMSACSIGYMDIFYRSAEYRIGPAGAYITREYGPMHTLHLTMLFIYTLAGIAVGLFFTKKKQ